MKHLFEIDKQGNVTFAPQVLAIKEFKELWKDRLPDREKAVAELSLLFFYIDVRSPLIRLEEDERLKEVLLDIMPDDPDWKPDKLWNACKDKYVELSRTPSMDSLDSALKVQREIDKFLQEVDLNERDDKGKLIHNVKQIQDMQKALPSTVKALQDVQRLVMTEMNEDLELRGGREKAEFEDAESNLG